MDTTANALFCINDTYMASSTAKLLLTSSVYNGRRYNEKNVSFITKTIFKTCPGLIQILTDVQCQFILLISFAWLCW